eukprot:m.1668616 g.1668616  ORF g.1668616 m.1668616 type:complete len:74 (-) comp153662_c0_seq1:25-246(-)
MIIDTRLPRSTNVCTFPSSTTVSTPGMIIEASLWQTRSHSLSSNEQHALVHAIFNHEIVDTLLPPLVMGTVNG